MDLPHNKKENTLLERIKHDVPAGIVVYLVALPLCLGIAFASHAPLLSGVIAGIVGGLIVASFSQSSIRVSGPAAGLTVIVIDSIDKLGGFEIFLLAVFFAGIMQLLFGYLRLGFISNYFPTPVIKGMLAGIGIILILKQIPHAIGYDIDYIGDLEFLQWDHENTFSELIHAFLKFIPGVALIGIISILIMILWPRIKSEKLKAIPAALIAVILAVVINQIFKAYFPNLIIGEEHLVNLPKIKGMSSLSDFFSFPNFSEFKNPKVYWIAITLALVASLETLLSISAVDKLDPLKRQTPANAELKAQGIGNVVSSLLGGLPITAVIVRGAANAGAGAKSKWSTIFHGFLLLISLVLFPQWINEIPLACLAAILLILGYKLTSIALIKRMYHQGWEAFIPFAATVFGIVFTDLLKGIGIGIAVASLFILRRNLQNPYIAQKKEDDAGQKIKLVLSEEVSFLNKYPIVERLKSVPESSEVIIDASKSRFIDDDILEAIEEFKVTAAEKNIRLELIGLKNGYQGFQHRKLENHNHREYEQLFVNNRKWMEDRLAHDPNYFKNLSLGQTPKYLFIGCSDSRVSDSEITGTRPGEMFVHRNIANLVIHTDMNLMSVLHYSIEVLKVEHVIVCGHYGCGGVKASLDNHDHGLIDKWLANIKDVYRLYYDELERISDPEERHRHLVELNVREQVYHLSMNSIVQNAWNNGSNLQIHGWVFDIREGLLKDLKIDIKQDKKLFNLYEFAKPAFTVI
jgi:carbonic anhydrase